MLGIIPRSGAADALACDDVIPPKSTTGRMVSRKQRKATTSHHQQILLILSYHFIPILVIIPLTTMILKTVSLVTLLVAGSEAFLARPAAIVKSPAHSPPSKLMVVDPNHIFDGAFTFLADNNADVIPGTSGEVSYSRASYYTILALYLSSFPGLWSTIKRSTSAKVKRKTYVT